MAWALRNSAVSVALEDLLQAGQDAGRLRDLVEVAAVERHVLAPLRGVAPVHAGREQLVELLQRGQGELELLVPGLGAAEVERGLVVPDVAQRADEGGVGDRLVLEAELQLLAGVDDPLQRVLVEQPRDLPLAQEVLGDPRRGAHPLGQVFVAIVEIDVASPHSVTSPRACSPSSAMPQSPPNSASYRNICGFSRFAARGRESSRNGRRQVNRIDSRWPHSGHNPRPEGSNPAGMAESVRPVWV